MRPGAYGRTLVFFSIQLDKPGVFVLFWCHIQETEVPGFGLHRDTGVVSFPGKVSSKG